MSEIRLSMKEILEKEFKSGMNGYRKDDVDAFLDVIIKDYETFNRKLDRLFQENDKLRKQVKTLTQSASQKIANPQQMGGSGTTNFDILMRISNLEKAVFGDRVNRDVQGGE